MIRAVIFDCFGVLVGHDGVDPALREVVTALKGRVKLGVLSNMSTNRVPELLGPDLVACFDEIVVSGELGAGKPDTRAYVAAAQYLGEFPRDCLLVDDSARNVAGAEETGMAAVRYTNPKELVQKLIEYGIITS